MLIKPAASSRLSQLKAALRQSKGSAAIKSTAALMQLTRGTTEAPMILVDTSVLIDVLANDPD